MTDGKKFSKLRGGLVSVTFRKLSSKEIVDLVVKSKLTDIEWGGDIHVPHGDTKTAGEVYKMTTDAGLRVSSYGSYYHVGHEDELAFSKVLESAAALHAPAIRVWAGHKGSLDADETYRATVVEDSRRIGDMAAEAGIKVSYEYHGKTLTDTNESALKLLKEVNHKNITTYWQPPNAKEIDYALAGLKDILPWLTQVHAYWWYPDYNTLHPLVVGKKGWELYLDAIASTGREHSVLLEFVPNDDPDVFLADAATLREWLAG